MMIIPQTVREKVLLSIALLFLAWASIYYGLWSPLSNHVNALRQSVASDSALVEWLHTVMPEIKAFSKNSASKENNNATPILEFLSSSLRDTQIYSTITQFTQSAAEEVTLQFKTVIFDNYLDWLKIIIASRRINITELSIERTPTPGMVNIHLILHVNL